MMVSFACLRYSGWDNKVKSSPDFYQLKTSPVSPVYGVQMAPGLLKHIHKRGDCQELLFAFSYSYRKVKLKSSPSPVMSWFSLTGTSLSYMNLRASANHQMLHSRKAFLHLSQYSINSDFLNHMILYPLKVLNTLIVLPTTCHSTKANHTALKRLYMHIEFSSN